MGRRIADNGVRAAAQPRPYRQFASVLWSLTEG